MISSDGGSNSALVTSDGAVAGGGGGGGGGGSNSVLLSWGAYLGSTGYYMDAWSRASGGVSATITEEAVIVAPFAGTITLITLALSGGNTDQDFQLFVNGVAQVTVEPATTELLHYATHTVSVSVSKGDSLAVKFNAGTAPAETLVGALLEAS